MERQQQAKSPVRHKVPAPRTTSLLSKPSPLSELPSGTARIFRRLESFAVGDAIQPDEAYQIIEELLWTLTWSNNSQHARFTVKQNSRSPNSYFPVFLKRAQLLHNAELSCVLVAASARESTLQFNALPRAAKTAYDLDYKPVEPFNFGLGMLAWPLKDRPSCWLISVWRSKFWVGMFDRSSGVISMVIDQKGSHRPRELDLGEAHDRKALVGVLRLISSGHHHPTDQTYKELSVGLGLVLGGIVVVPGIDGNYHGADICRGHIVGPVDWADEVNEEIFE